MTSPPRPLLGAQAYRHGLRGSAPSAGAAGALGLVGFFGVPVPLAGGEMPLGVALFLGLTPLVGGACSADGALFLARGVDRHRAKHGTTHAPRVPVVGERPR